MPGKLESRGGVAYDPAVRLVGAGRFFWSHAEKWLAIARVWLQFQAWRMRSPGASFGEFYAGSIAGRIARGSSHRTLGGRRFFAGGFLRSDPSHSSKSFSATGRKRYLQLLALGVVPRHICIDYGCGSLRVGQHLIRHLHRGNYWGLDLIDDFYRIGLDLIGDDLVAGKRPQLRVIDPDSLDEVRRAEPDLVFSIAVLKHVPPGELGVYLRNILGLRAPHTRVAIFFVEADRTARIAGTSWSYDRQTLEAAIRRRDPDARVRFAPQGVGKAETRLRRMILLIDAQQPRDAADRQQKRPVCAPDSLLDGKPRLLHM